MLPTETKLLEREPDKIQAGFQRRTFGVCTNTAGFLN